MIGTVKVGGVIGRYGLAVLAGWLLGIATTLGWTALGGGYEYSVAETESQARRMVNREGWEIVPGSGGAYLRRPRLRFHGIQPPVLPAEQAGLTPVTAPSEAGPIATPQPTQEPITLNGALATHKTDPFQLVGGTYRVEWRAAAPSTRNCQFRAWLRPTADSRASKEVTTRIIPSGQEALGLAWVYDVAPGEHYLDLTPSFGERCQWTLTMQQWLAR